MMKVSLQNILHAQVRCVVSGAVNGRVELKVNESETINACLSMKEIEFLGLEVSSIVNVFFSANDVILAKSNNGGLIGTISNINEGAVNGVVKVALNNWHTVSACIPMEVIRGLGLAEGDSVSCFIQPSKITLSLSEEIEYYAHLLLNSYAIPFCGHGAIALEDSKNCLVYSFGAKGGFGGYIQNFHKYLLSLESKERYVNIEDNRETFTIESHSDQTFTTVL